MAFRGLRVEGDDPNGPPLIFGVMLEYNTYPLARRLLPRSYRSALSQLRSCYCSNLQSYRHSVGKADDSACPNCRSTDHTVAHLFSCPTHPTDLAPGDMWVPHLQLAQFVAELPQFCDLPPLQIDFASFPS